MIPYENGLAPAEAGTQPDGGHAVQGMTAPCVESSAAPTVGELLDALREVDENATDGTPYALTYLVAE